MPTAQPRHHVLDIYGVHLHLATTKREWKKLRKDVTFLGDVPTSRGMASWATWEPKPSGKSVPHLVFWVDVSQHIGDQLDLIDTCAHEAAHQKAGDEPHAYLVGWLTRWIYGGCTTT